MCRVSFKQFSSFLRRCSGDGGRAAKPQILRKSASGNTQYKLTQHQLSLARRFALDPMGRLPSTCQWRCPLTPACAAAPAPRHKGLAALCTPLRRSWLPPQKRFPPVHRLRIHTVTPIGGKWIRIRLRGLPSKRRVQTRHFCRNRPDFRRFFLLPLPPESHALWRKHWRRLSVPRCKAG